MTLLDESWKDAEVGNLDKIAYVALQELKGIDIYALNTYANSRKEIIDTLYKTGSLNDENIEKSLRKAVIKRGKADCEMLLLPMGCIGFLNMRADRLNMPMLLAYCISEGIFSDEVLKRIPLKRKETIESFVKKYENKDLLSDLRKDLLNPWPETYPTFFITRSEWTYLHYG